MPRVCVSAPPRRCSVPREILPPEPASPALAPRDVTSHLIIMQACVRRHEDRVAWLTPAAGPGLSSVTSRAHFIIRGAGPGSVRGPEEEGPAFVAITLVAGGWRRTHGVVRIQGCPQRDHRRAIRARAETPSRWVGPATAPSPRLSQLRLAASQPLHHAPPPPRPPQCTSGGGVGGWRGAFDWVWNTTTGLFNSKHLTLPVPHVP